MEVQYLPAVRDDILAEINEEDGREYLYLSDPKGYATQPVSIPKEFLPLLSFLDGSYTLDNVKEILIKNNNQEIDDIIDSFNNLINFLDYMGFLQSKRFEWIKQDIDNYLNSRIRTPYCAGSSYSDNREELEQELEQIFSVSNPEDVKPGADMIIVPHIDFRVGLQAHKAYSKGYYALMKSEPNLVVIFGTSHLGSSKRFILTEKDFKTPLGIARNATDLIDFFRENATDQDEIIIDDISHRNEHSIEFQVLLSQYFFKDKPFKILPVLVNSFMPDIAKGQLPAQDFYFNGFLMKLNEALSKSDYKPVFICSVDFAHVGRKFGDDFNADLIFDELKQEDEKLIHHLAHCNADNFFKQVMKSDDKYRICGLAPIYSLLKFRNPKESRFLQYEIWNEKETNSAVSFASFAFYK